MKNNIKPLATLFIVAFIFASCSSEYSKTALDRHIEYIKKSHNENCPYKLGECSEKLCSHYDDLRAYLRDYQIELHNDTVRVFDSKRLVGQYLTTWSNQIDTIFLEDNQ